MSGPRPLPAPLSSAPRTAGMVCVNNISDKCGDPRALSTEKGLLKLGPALTSARAHGDPSWEGGEPGMACPTHVQSVSGTGPSRAQGLRTQCSSEPRDQGPGSGVLPRSSEPLIFLVRWGRAAPESVWKGQGDGPTGGVGCNRESDTARDRLRGRDGVWKEAQGVSDLQALRSQETGD